MDSLAEHQKKTQEGWGACDTTTLVSAARERLYEEFPSSSGKQQKIAPIEEALNRLDQVGRVTSPIPVGFAPVGQQ